MNNVIYPCLWFDNNAKEAATFYTTVFNDAAIINDTPMVVRFEASGQKFMCLNGGPYFTINPSISFSVTMESDAAIDKAWQHLSENGTVLMALDKYAWSEKYGWVQDQFGVNWQLSLGKPGSQKFIPSFMFTGPQQGKAEEAIRFYTSIFDNSTIEYVAKYDANDNDVEGTVKHAQFTLNGFAFIAMDSSMAHKFNFNEGLSIVVECKDQQEIDYYWNKLTEGGSESQCGWLKDKFGVSWQIVPVVLSKLMSDPERSGRVMQAFMKMKKFDIESLENA